MNPIISFIIPVFNGEKYIERAVKSVLRCSDAEYSIEVIIVNDGSTDQTDSICKFLVKSDERIQYVYQKNAGVSRARNKGIMKAKGLFISFIDADDELLSEQITPILPLIAKKTDEIWAFDFSIVDENGIFLQNVELGEPSVFSSSRLKSRFVAYPVLGRLEDSKEYLGAKIYQYFIPRKLLIENKILFDENLAFAEDMCFLYSVMSNNLTCNYINKTMYRYYVYSSSVSHSFRTQFYNDWEKVQAYLERFVTEDEFDSLRLGIKSMVHHYYANHYSYKNFAKCLNDNMLFNDEDKMIIKKSCKAYDLYQLFYKYSILLGSTRFEHVVIKNGGKLLRAKDKIVRKFKKG